MKILTLLIALTFAAGLYTPLSGAEMEVGSGGLGPVCDTKALAEKYVELFDSGMPASEALASINKGKVEPVCVIVWVFWHDSNVLSERRMRDNYVNILAASVLRLGVNYQGLKRLPKPKTLYIIVQLPGRSA